MKIKGWEEETVKQRKADKCNASKGIITVELP